MKIEFSLLQDLAFEVDGDARTYSGRGMYGKSCAGITISDESSLVELGAAIVTTIEDEDLSDTLIKGARLDSMGRGVIVYWPTIETDGDDEDEEDE